MSEWKQVPFSELLIESRDGEWGEGHEVIGHQLCEVIRGTDFANLNDSKCELPRRWVPDHLVDRKRLTVGDIVFEMAGGTAKQSTGRSSLLNATFFQQHHSLPVLCASFCRHLRLDRERYQPEFIYYLLQALYAAGYMSVFNIQHTGVSRFQYTSFKKQTVLDIPSLSSQQKIAAILSAYDDLIENNRRRIALLEKMAEEIYREWFVRMRFPGHEQAKFEKGMPVGWQVKRVAELVVRKKFGRIYREGELFSEGAVVVIDQSRSECLGFHDGPPEHAASPESPVILFGDHSCKMQLMFEQFSLAENVIPFVGNGIPPVFLFYLVHSLIETTEYKRHWTDLVAKEIYLPTYELRSLFNDRVRDLIVQTKQLRSACHQLNKMRDALLPRLISGKLAVDDLDIRFPPGMAEASALAI